MSINAAHITPSEAFNVLMQGFYAQRDHGLFQCFMLHGKPGVGKSKTADKFAKAIGARLYDWRMSTRDAADVRGLPSYNHDKQQTVWYRPEDLPEDDGNWSVLLLDEITSCPPHLVPTVYGIMQERRIGEFLLPDKCVIIAAGNTVEDGAMAYEMNTALSDRLTHMVVVQDAESWIADVAIPESFDPAVLTLLRARPDLLHTTDEALKNGDTVAATGRSWEVVSNIRKHIKDKNAQEIMITGRVGTAIANEFFNVARDIDKSVDVIHMLKEPAEKRISLFPSSLDALNGLSFGILGHVNEENYEASIEILTTIVELDTLRPNEGFAVMPLSELATFAIEALGSKFTHDITMLGKIASSSAYKKYYARRKELGLVG